MTRRKKFQKKNKKSMEKNKKFFFQEIEQLAEALKVI